MLLVIIALSVIVGWTLGYLRLPYINDAESFSIGFVCCLALILLIIVLLFSWNRQQIIMRFISEKQTTENAQSPRRKFIRPIAIVMVILLSGTLVSGLIMIGQTKKYGLINQARKTILKEQDRIITLVKNSNFGDMISVVLVEAEKELELNIGDTLSTATINRIATLSSALKPYRYFQGDSLSTQELSLERGQLLLALNSMRIDSSTFYKIKRATSFSCSDLRNADLNGADLSGIDLSNSNLENANLISANLINADLRSTNFRAANLSEALLMKADLKRADLSWAKMNNAQMKLAVFNGACMRNTQLMQADLREALFQYAELSGAMFNEANLTGSDLIGTRFTKTNFTKVNLSEVRFVQADFSEAIMLEAEMTNAEVEKDWMEKAIAWKIIGSKEILDTYRVDSSLTDARVAYRLQRKK